MTQSSWIYRSGRRRLAAGLAWMPLQAKERKDAMRKLREAVRGQRVKHAALSFQSDAPYPLGGIVVPSSGKRIDGKLAGLVPAAIWFGAIASHPTIYVEKVGSGYWVLAGVNGQLDVRTDVVVSSTQASTLVSELLDGFMLIGSKLDLYLHPDTSAASLTLPIEPRRADLVSIIGNGAPPKARVAKIIGIPKWVPIACLAIIGAGVTVYAVKSVHSLIEQRQIKAELDARQAQAAANDLIHKHQQEQALARSSETALQAIVGTPSPVQFVQSCLSAMDSMPFALGGWTRQKVVCEGGQLQIEYAQSNQGVATEMEFRAAAAALELQADISWFGTAGRITLPVQAPVNRTPPALADLPSVQKTGEVLSSLATAAAKQFAGVNITASEPKPAEMPAIGATKPEPAFMSGSVRISGPSSWLIEHVIPDNTNLTLTRLELVGPNLQWQAVGTFVTSLT